MEENMTETTQLQNPPAPTTVVNYAPVPPATPSWQPLLSHACALAVAGFFLYFALGKIKDPRQFAIDIGNFQVLSKYWSASFAIVLPWWEIGAALALLLPRTRVGGAILIGGMLIMFIVAVCLALSKGLDISCGCAGHGSGKAGWSTIGRNVLLLAGTVLSVYFLPRRTAPKF